MAQTSVAASDPSPKEHATEVKEHSDGSSVKEKLELGEFHLFNGNPKAAIKAYKEAVTLDPNLLEARLSLADLYARTGNNAAAIEQFREALRIKPDQQGLNLLLGQLLSAENDLDGAIECFTRETQLTNNSLPSESNLAFALLAKDKNDLAAQKFRELIGRDSDNSDFHLGLAMALSKMKQTDEALREIDTALKVKPKSAEAHDLRGDIYFLLGQKERAVEEYKKAIEDDKTFAQSYLSLGNFYLKEGKFQEGRDIFIQGGKIAPANRDILYGLAFSLEQCGDFASALAVFQKALQLETDAEKAQSIKEHIMQLQSEQAPLNKSQ